LLELVEKPPKKTHWLLKFVKKTQKASHTHTHTYTQAIVEKTQKTYWPLVQYWSLLKL